ncbi:glycosyltransferase family 2 protein [uncultured Microbacterium sp.]|uniref:glycosyltransferase family 2 protein n=1 Tax=uncultured Microbacterium sp. TaxID=191216 RepID=UPI0028E8A7E1|nr:glycosyltransferase family 2 protein [uncultured Microbacterium sp.]
MDDVVSGLPAAAASVSVVMPHYNASRTLARALDSVMRQSREAAEVIVVDDASAQDEREAAQRTVESYPGTRLILLDRNGGPAHARNVGWDAAVGDWVAFLDCDDAWHPRKLETQLALALGSGTTPHMIAGRTVQLAAPEELGSMPLNASAPAYVIRKRDLLVRNRMSTPSVLVRRDLPLRFSAGRRFSEDYELWLSIAGLGHTIVFLDAPVAAIFKAPYGDSGLSARIWPMIVGEYQAYIGARRVGALNRLETVVGIAISTGRAGLRVVRLLARRVRRGAR